MLESPTSDKSGYIEHELTPGGLNSRGNLFHIKDDSGKRVTLLPGKAFPHINRP